MAAETTIELLPPGPWTVDDLDHFPEDNARRYELIDGALLVTFEPTLQHQRVTGSLGQLLEASCPAHLEVFFLPVNVRISERRQLVPDAVVVRREDAQGRRLTGLPLLVVEVQSSSTRTVDLVLKRQVLQEAGVSSYWLVEPDEQVVTVLELQSGAYREVARVSPGQVLDLRVPFPLRLVPAELGR